MANVVLTNPAAVAARLERRLGARLAFQRAKDRLATASARRDQAAVDHWSAVGLLVVEAWNACPPTPPPAD